MSDSGSGQGTPIPISSVPSTVYDQMEELLTTPNCAVSLSRYAKLIGYEEAAFWGVVWENQYLRGCDPLWTEYQRMSIANALAEAQQEIEQAIGYPLCPTYISGTYDDNPRWVDQQCYKRSIVTRYPRILAVGVPVTSVIESEAEVDHESVAGVGVIGPLATSATSVEEIKIFYPGSNRQITPSRITLSSGNVTIQIPRFRMLKQEFLNEGSDPNSTTIRYENINFFLASVDVKRIYTDSSTQAVLVRPNCRNNSCANGCYECTQSACMYLRDPFLGVVDVNPANWDADLSEWKTNVVCRYNYSLVRLNYLAGVRSLDLQAELAIVRLAHSKMGRPPCQCDRTGEMWKWDYDVTGAVTRERVNCPFGLSNGAWNAWKWSQDFAARRASIF